MHDRDARGRTGLAGLLPVAALLVLAAAPAGAQDAPEAARVTLWEQPRFEGRELVATGDLPEFPVDFRFPGDEDAVFSSVRVEGPVWAILYDDPDFGDEALCLQGPLDWPDLGSLRQPRQVPIPEGQPPDFKGDWDADMASLRILRETETVHCTTRVDRERNIDFPGEVVLEVGAGGPTD